MAVNNRGWFDNRANIEEILRADEFLSQLVFRNLNSNDLNQSPMEVVIAAVTFFCHARYPAHQKPIRSREYIDSIVIGEMMAPVIPVVNSLGQEMARTEFSAVVEYMLNNPTVHNRSRGFPEWQVAMAEANLALEEGARRDIVDRADMVFGDYMDYLLWLAFVSPSSMYMSPTALVVSSYVGIAKRGTLSDQFAEKVVNGMRDDLGIEIVLDTQMIKFAYVNFGKYITADNAAGVFERWLEDIPQHALRLQLCLSQVAGSGLTAYIIIGRSMRRFPDFPWDRLDILTSGEVTRYLAALATVRGNMYYGFNRDLGAARSTLYSSVAYVAKELLIKVSGEMSLTKYQGWLKRPKNPASVTALIDNYVTSAQERMTAAADNPLNPDILNGILQRVNDPMHNDMFA